MLHVHGNVGHITHNGGWYKSIHEMGKVHIQAYKSIPCLKQSSGHDNPQAQSHNTMQMRCI